ncbi:MAG: helix-turn-helix domain-containing protein [Candidatus Binataceae bacterium]|jgi:excisionase family DNA binding protein
MFIRGKRRVGRAHRPKTDVEVLALRVSQVATAMGMSEQFVREEIERGHLGCMRLGRRVRVSPSELERYLKANTIAPAARVE